VHCYRVLASFDRAEDVVQETLLRAWRNFTAFAGGSVAAPPRRLVPIGTDLFAPAGMPLAAFNGYSRVMLVSYHGVRDGHASYRCAGGRLTRRV
jgi:hypothetical protein